MLPLRRAFRPDGSRDERRRPDGRASWQDGEEGRLTCAVPLLIRCTRLHRISPRCTSIALHPTCPKPVLRYRSTAAALNRYAPAAEEAPRSPEGSLRAPSAQPLRRTTQAGIACAAFELVRSPARADAYRGAGAACCTVRGAAGYPVGTPARRGHLWTWRFTLVSGEDHHDSASLTRRERALGRR